MLIMDEHLQISATLWRGIRTCPQCPPCAVLPCGPIIANSSCLSPQPVGPRSTLGHRAVSRGLGLATDGADLSVVVDPVRAQTPAGAVAGSTKSKSKATTKGRKARSAEVGSVLGCQASGSGNFETG